MRQDEARPDSSALLDATTAEGKDTSMAAEEERVTNITVDDSKHINHNGTITIQEHAEV